MANDNSTAVVKEFIANGRKYDVTIVASNNQATANEVADIFNSFKIIR